MHGRIKMEVEITKAKKVGGVGFNEIIMDQFREIYPNSKIFIDDESWIITIKEGN